MWFNCSKLSGRWKINSYIDKNEDHLQNSDDTVEGFPDGKKSFLPEIQSKKFYLTQKL